MKLKKMTASFGKLDNQTLVLGDGLNIITAPNESGKSTWAGFLKAMLYGIDTKDRDKKGYLADKNRYQPWSGKPMLGEMDLSWGDRDITLRRSPKGNTPFAVFSATYTGTESPVPALTAEGCGFTLTGVGREVYERSAFLGAGSHAVTATPELERRIAALVTTGEEEISFSQVEEKLKEWSRTRKLNKSVGLIPKLEGELEQLDEILSQMASQNGQIAQLSAQKVQLEATLSQIEADLHQHQLWESQRKNQKYQLAKSGKEEAERQLDALLQDVARFENLPTQERLRHWQGELAVLNSLEKEVKLADTPIQAAQEKLDEAKKLGEDKFFGQLAPKDALELCQRESANYQDFGNQIAKLKHRPLIFSLLGLFSAGILAGATLYLNLPIYILAGVGTLVAVLWVSGILSTRNKKKNLIKQQAGILEKYEIAEITQLESLGQHYATRQTAIEVADGELRNLLTQKRQRLEQKDSLQTRIFEFVHSFSPQVQSLIGCSAAISRSLQLEEELAVARANLAGATRLFDAMAEEGGEESTELPTGELPQQSPVQLAAQRGATQDELRRIEDGLSQLLGRQQASGDPAQLAAQREAVAEELGRRQLELTALDTALKALRNANSRLQERFSPQLNARAAHYLSLLTGGSYTNLSLTRELEGKVTGVGDTLPHSALYLSRGTADQLYLAVRLAVCDLCLPGDEAVPLVLDDALTAFDQSRMERALDLLCQLAETRQILLFSCHRREGDYLAGRDRVTCISL